MRIKSFLVLMLVAGAFKQAPSYSIRGHIHPLAQRRFDRGRVNDLFQMNYVTMMFKPTAEQQAALNSLLVEQQDPSSPNYHQWVTPEEFADRFSLSTTEFEKVTAWLQDQGFTIDNRARSRNWIAFTGTARQMERAFNVQIHEYAVNGKTHYATATEPVVPAAFADRVLGFRSLHDFRPKSRLVKANFTSSISGNHFITPDDWATIYDAQALYKSGITGAGQKIAIMGVSDIELGDIRSFRAASGLPANDPQIVLVPGSKDPGVVDGDVNEASLDVEWSGAIAKNATIILVVDATDPLLDSLPYAVSQNLAPVISVSYGECEPDWAPTDQSSLVATTQQANAQGITITVASGDAGAADCDFSTPATLGLTVDLPAGLPYVTAMGGTEFNESGSVWSTAQTFGSFFGKGPGPIFWSSTNNGNNGSALSYIPEIAWNDSLFDGQPSSTGGGKSSLFQKPSWQVAPGVPNDNARDVPDISFSSSADFDPYLACISGSCVNGYRAVDNSLMAVGGTSVGAPSFAGVVALINQMTNSRQGNVNPTLYRLAGTNRTAFHDITQSGNQIQCRAGSPDCGAAGFIGFAAAPGYDLATGLGSVDVGKLLQAWPKTQP
jgi:subtilase family serine protease